MARSGPPLKAARGQLWIWPGSVLRYVTYSVETIRLQLTLAERERDAAAERAGTEERDRVAAERRTGVAESRAEAETARADREESAAEELRGQLEGVRVDLEAVSTLRPPARRWPICGAPWRR